MSRRTARHRATRQPIYWRWNYRWLRNRWHCFVLPQIKDRLREFWNNN